MGQGLDENITRKLKAVRMDLRISVAEHDKRSEKNRALISAISEFLGDQSSRNPPPQDRGEYGWLTGAIRGVIKGAEYKSFTLEDVELVLEILGAPTERKAISVALWKMAERGELSIIERGAGRKPTIYKPEALQIIRHKRT